MPLTSRTETLVWQLTGKCCTFQFKAACDSEQSPLPMALCKSMMPTCKLLNKSGWKEGKRWRHIDPGKRWSAIWCSTRVRRTSKGGRGRMAWQAAYLSWPWVQGQVPPFSSCSCTHKALLPLASLVAGSNPACHMPVHKGGLGPAHKALHPRANRHIKHLLKHHLSY